MTLEDLPAELRLQILLSFSDVADLQAVVHASPVFHRQYLLDRQNVFGRVLETTMAGTFVEAYAVHTSTRLAKLDGELSEEAIEQFLDKYRVLRSDPGAALRQCALDDLLGMAAYYRDVIQPLVEYYSALFLSKLDSTGSSPRARILSRTERVRFLRAFYRFQLYTNLFCSSGTLYALTQHFHDMYILTTLFDIYKPWEAEEIACVSIWVKARYQQAFEAIRWHVYRESPGHDHWEWRDAPPGVYPREGVAGVSPLSIAIADHQTDQLRLKGVHEKNPMLGGLKLFRQILETINFDELVQLMQETILWRRGYSLGQCLSSDAQIYRRFAAAESSEHDRAEIEKERMVFTGDEADAPPLAWVLLWREAYGNWFGEVVPPSLHDWGYIFWDELRLVETGAKDAVLRDRWPEDDDPRERPPRLLENLNIVS
ncbi:hypothetical protein C8A00DRAFT_18923 [Chaetomidium leptoderma]|uniref:F-box domain-containing protein n=1 Tax=Chaetomidium leptoderma TaxID=669021 RepID=A0AAN6VDC3_9PEZI|nr:hypothetical protein C8A00DRAFT_18923 [Chaetomidium leptoderma]